MSTVAGLSPQQEWLAKHAGEYRGLWIALDEGRLVASGPDAMAVFRSAKAAGVRCPLVRFIDDDPWPWGGW